MIQVDRYPTASRLNQNSSRAAAELVDRRHVPAFHVISTSFFWYGVIGSLLWCIVAFGAATHVNRTELAFFVVHTRMKGKTKQRRILRLIVPHAVFWKTRAGRGGVTVTFCVVGGRVPAIRRGTHDTTGGGDALAGVSVPVAVQRGHD